jgi:probable F420-dependent oxidoreductase
VEHRYGLTIPLPPPLHAQRELIASLPDRGFTDVWSHEVDNADGFTPLVLASQWAPGLRLGAAIIPAFTRTPPLIAQQAAALADAAPGRFVLGLGSSSSVIIEDWNGLRFEKPYQRVRDVTRFLRRAFAGEKISEDYETFSVAGFRLGRVPEQPPPIYLAALREGMLRLAGREGDGVILNFLSPDDVKQVLPLVGGGDRHEVVARVFVVPITDGEAARQIARFVLAAYLNVPVYAAFHEWLGRGDRLRPMWEAWKRGERKEALAAIPDGVIDELVVHGPPGAIRERIEQYHAAGVHTTTVAVPQIPGLDPEEAVDWLAPV